MKIYSDQTSNKFYSLTLLFTLILSIGIFNAQAQLDPTFGVNGAARTDIGNFDSLLSTFVLPNQKILVFSKNYVGQNQPSNYYFIRYNSDGTLDSTYGTNGISQLSIPLNSANGTLVKAVRQADGMILLVGWDGIAGLLARVDENGTLDNSFATGGVHRPNLDAGTSQSMIDWLFDAAILPDGKILVGGRYNGLQKLFFMKYLPNGSVDTSFNAEGFIIYDSPSPLVEQIFVQTDGKFVLYGAGGDGKLLKRYNADGSIDNSFAQVGFSSPYSKAVIMLADDKFVFAEQFTRTVSLERNNNDLRIKKFNADGTIDNSFGTSGETIIDLSTNFDDNLFALSEQTDGQILIAGTTYVEPNRTQLSGWQIALMRLSSNGTLNGKYFVTEGGYSNKGFVSLLPGGKILTANIIIGPQNNADIHLTRTLGVPFETYIFKGVPFDYGKLPGYPQIDGIADPSVFRSDNQRWYVYPIIPQASDFLFGLGSDILVPSDYIDDLGTELAVFRPGNGTWYIARDVFNSSQNYISIQFGLAGDIPVPSDYDNDSKSDIAVFRPNGGVWFVRNSDDNSVTITQWGTNGDKPVTGDYDGDGRADLAVWRPTDGIWYVLRSSDNQPSFTKFGLDGDIPVQEDYDGDGITDIAVWRPSTRVWYILRSSDGGFSAAQFGLSDDYAVPADYDGDKKTDIALWRPSQGRWYYLRSSDNSLGIVNWGISTDKIPQRRQ